MGVTTAPAGELSGPDHYGRLKPGPSQSQLEVIASQRARLQRAIVELAARDGIDAVTVRRLTKRARVSTSSFYSRFSGTDDCLLSAYGELMSGVVRAVLETRSPELARARQLERALKALLDGLLADRDVARFTLIEIYDGGPNAIAAVQGQEEALISALRGCVDRRGERAPRAAVVAIVAAVLHCARTKLIDASSEESAPIVDELRSWAMDVIEGREEFLCPSTPPSQARRSDPAPESRRDGVVNRGEKEMIESAILRLARNEGFRGLDCKKVGSMSGLPAARFRRHFGTLADGYLAAIRRTSASFFAELTAAADSEATARPSIRAALDRAARRAASDPVAARLTFRQVIEPGVAGLTCREALISELAVACADEGEEENPSMRVRAEARVAALWETLAQAAQSS